MAKQKPRTHSFKRRLEWLVHRPERSAVGAGYLAARIYPVAIKSNVLQLPGNTQLGS